MRGLIAGCLLTAASGCAQIIGADFGDARPRDAATTCDRDTPFGPPRRLPLNDQLLPAFAPRLSGDQRLLYFSSADDVFVASRATLADEFANPVPLTSINGPAADMGASVTADGLAFFLETTRAGDVKLFAAVCSGCGKETEVPFQPRLDRPVYCRDCFQERRASSPRGGYSNY